MKLAWYTYIETEKPGEEEEPFDMGVEVDDGFLLDVDYDNNAWYRADHMTFSNAELKRDVKQKKMFLISKKPIPKGTEIGYMYDFPNPDWETVITSPEKKKRRQLCVA